MSFFTNDMQQKIHLEKCTIFNNLTKHLIRLIFLGNVVTHLTFTIFVYFFGQQYGVDVE